MLDDTKRIPNFTFGDPDHCTYCGGRATDLDHVVPVSSYSDLPRKQKGDAPGLKTYSCKSCNSYLGSKVFPNFKARLEYIASLNTKKAQKFSREASWSDEEIAECDYTLQTFIASRQMAMREADEKTSWPLTASFAAAMSSLNGVHCLDPSHPKYVEWARDFFIDYL